MSKVIINNSSSVGSLRVNSNIRVSAEKDHIDAISDYSSFLAVFGDIGTIADFHRKIDNHKRMIINRHDRKVNSLI